MVILIAEINDDSFGNIDANTNADGKTNAHSNEDDKQ